MSGHRTPSPAPLSPRPPLWAWLGLLAILVFNVWLRGHTFGPIVRDRVGLDLWLATGEEAEPLDCDESAYAYIGRRILDGDVLYRDLTENKPPLGYWIYTLAVAIGGANELTIRLMPIPMVLATIGLVWWIAWRLSGPGAACLAAWIYAVVSTDPFLYGNGAHLEHPINLFAVASLAVMVLALSRRRPVGLLVAAGALVGATSLVRQVGIMHLILYGLVLLVRRPPGHPAPTFGRRLADLSTLAVGFVVSWLVAVGVLVAQGAGRAAFDDVILYGGALATETTPDPNAPPGLVRWFTGNADPDGELPPPFGTTDWLVWWGRGSWPLWLAALPSLAWLLRGRGREPPARRLVAGWTLSAWVQVALPGLFWAHYYLMPVPGLALAVAITIADALRARTRAGRFAATLLIAAVLATAAIQVRDYLLVPPQQLTEHYKGGRQWVALRDLGRDLARRSEAFEDPRIYIWGWQSPLFIYANMDGVCPHFFADPLLKDKAQTQPDHPLIRPRLDRILRDLDAHRPVWIFAGDPPFPELRRFLREHYLPAPGFGAAPDGRGLWVERGAYGQVTRP